MKPNNIAIFALLAIASTVSYAAAPELGADSVLGIIQSSMAPAINKLTAQAITWLAVFASLQFVITNYGVLKSDGDIQMVIAKLAGGLIWVGFCLFIINNGPQFIGAVGDQMFGLLGLTLPSPGSIIASTIGVVAALAALAVGVGGIGIIGSTTAGMLLVYVLLFVLAIGMFFAFKIFMLKLELGLVVMLSPLSFAFLGLNALKDQGIAPFKALISLTYRIILLTIILSAFTEVSNVASSALSGLSKDAIMSGIGEAIMTVLSALGAYMMLAYLVYKSDSIAASLAGGSTNMGTGDVASAAAAGAAAGAAVATGGASLAGTAAKAPQAMGAFMKSLAGGGSVSNASGTGTGSTQMGPAPSSPSLMSKSSGGSSPDGAQSKSASTANSSPRPSSLVGVGAAKHASEGVAAAGGSQAASDAAATTAAAGGSNEDVAAAVVGAGGTEAQGAAAATAMAVGEAGGSASAIKAGAQAAGAGMSPSDVAHAVTNAVSPGSAFGASQEVAAAAAKASTTKPGQNAAMTNSSPRPSSLVGVGAAKHASEGVAAAGGSQAASDAAAMTAAAGGSNEDVAAAVVGAGGTEAQGAAAATAMAVGEAGGSANAIKAGAQAAGAGMRSSDVAHAVMHAVSPGSAFGASQEVGAAAAAASTTKPTSSTGSGASSGIGGPGSPLEQKFEKLIDMMNNQQGQSRKPSFGDRLKDVNQHVSQEKAATHVSINTHHSD